MPITYHVSANVEPDFRKVEILIFNTLWFFMIFLDEFLRFLELGTSPDPYFECLKRYFELVYLSQPCGGQKGANFSTNWGTFKNAVLVEIKDFMSL